MYKRKYHQCLIGLTILSLINLSLVIALTNKPNNNPEKVDPTPDHVLASVYFGCSGTIISKGETRGYGVSCNHCYRVTGNSFTVHYADGSKTDDAKVEALDAAHDLMLFSVPSESILAISQIPLKQVPDSGKPIYEVCGYPAHRGPMWYDLKNPSVDRINKNSLERWKFDIAEEVGTIEKGNSGCGIFVNGQLCSVLSHRDSDPNNPGRTAFSCPHQYLVEFCSRECKKINGRWNCEKPPNNNQKAPGPGEWQPSPKQPLDTDKIRKLKVSQLKALIKELEGEKSIEGNKDDAPEAPKLPEVPVNQPGLGELKAELIKDFESKLGPIAKQILSKSDIESMLQKALNNHLQDINDHLGPLGQQLNKLEANIDPNLAGKIITGVENSGLGQKIITGVEGSGLGQKIISGVEGSGLGAKIVADVSAVLPAVPGIGTLMAAGGIAGGIPGLALMGVGFMIHRKLKNKLPNPPDPTSTPTNQSEMDALGKLVDALATKGQPDITAKLDQVLTALANNKIQQPEANQGLLDKLLNALIEKSINKVPNPNTLVQQAGTISGVDTTVVMPAANNAGVQAFQAMKRMIVQKHPELVTNGYLQKMDSLFSQALSGLHSGG